MNLIPEVTDLMARIREERNAHLHNGFAMPAEPLLDLPSPAAPLPPPPGQGLAAPAAAAASDAPIPEMLVRAGEKLAVGGLWPGWLRPLARNQGGFNGIVLEAMERVWRGRQEMQGQLQRLQAQVAEQGAWLGVLAGSRTQDREWMLAANAGLVHGVSEANAQRRRGDRSEKRLDLIEQQHSQTRRDIEHHAADIDQIETHAGALHGQMESLREHLLRVDQRLEEFGHVIGELNRLLDGHGVAIQAATAQLEGLQAHVDQSLQAHVDRQNARNDALEARLTKLQAQTEAFETHRIATENHLRSLQTHAESHDAHRIGADTHLARLQAHADTHDAHRAEADAHLARLQAHADTHDSHRAEADAHLARLQAHAENLGERSTQIQREADAHNDRVDGHLRQLQDYVDRQHARHMEDAPGKSLREQAERFDERQERVESALGKLDERQIADASYLKSQLGFLGRLFERLNVPHDPGAGGEPDQARLADAAAEHDNHEFDAYYLAFEHRFRGSREVIKERLRAYLPTLESARIGSFGSQVLDLGCGRGEWLELLRENSFTATGVDLNASMIEQCRERGLDVTAANALDFLRELPDGSRGAITAFHLIEHLPFRVLFQFVRECLRVLQPGGVAIFETPNPENVMVGACEFWYDYTHQRPIPPGAARFLAEQVGFAEARVMPLQPVPENQRPRPGVDAVLPERVYSAFYGPRDYAIVAAKACTS